MLSFKEYSELNESTEAIDAIKTVLNHPKIKPDIDNVNKVMDSVNKHIKIHGPIFADKLAKGFNEALGPGAVSSYTLTPILTTALEVVANRHKFMGKK